MTTKVSIDEVTNMSDMSILSMLCYLRKPRLYLCVSILLSLDVKINDTIDRSFYYLLLAAVNLCATRLKLLEIKVYM